MNYIYQDHKYKYILFYLKRNIHILKYIIKKKNKIIVLFGNEQFENIQILSIIDH